MTAYRWRFMLGSKHLRGHKKTWRRNVGRNVVRETRIWIVLYPLSHLRACIRFLGAALITVHSQMFSFRFCAFATEVCVAYCLCWRFALNLTVIARPLLSIPSRELGSLRVMARFVWQANHSWWRPCHLSSYHSQPVFLPLSERGWCTPRS